MTMKSALRKYFELRREYFDKGLDFLFKAPYHPNHESMIDQGPKDEDDEILWKPIEKNIDHDFSHIERNYDIKLHHSIVHYFNSFWFVDLDGFISDHYIKLASVLPHRELMSFAQNLKGYRENHTNEVKKVPIGIEGNGLLVVLDNISGVVELEDFEKGSFEKIADTLEELILRLRLIK